MWVPKAGVEWFQISKTSVDYFREELAATRAERDLLKTQLTKAEIEKDWLRMKVNSLELQNTALLEKAYDIRVPAPEIVRQPAIDPTWDPRSFSFEDVGNELASKMGLPVYGDKEN